MNLKSWNCTCQCIVVMGNNTSIIIRSISISTVAIGTSAVAVIKGKNQIILLLNQVMHEGSFCRRSHFCSHLCVILLYMNSRQEWCILSEALI